MNKELEELFLAQRENERTKNRLAHLDPSLPRIERDRVWEEREAARTRLEEAEEEIAQTT